MLDHLAVAKARDVDFGDGDATAGQLHPGEISAMGSGDDRAIRGPRSPSAMTSCNSTRMSGNAFGIGGEESFQARQICVLAGKGP